MGAGIILGIASYPHWLLSYLRVERSAVSVASLRSELEALGPVKPILEELGRQLQNSRRGADHVLNLDRSAQGPCARCARYGGVPHALRLTLRIHRTFSL